MAAAGHLMGQLALAPSTAALLWAARPALVLSTPRLCVVPACFSTVGAPTLAAVLTPPPLPPPFPCRVWHHPVHRLHPHAAAGGAEPVIALPARVLERALRGVGLPLCGAVHRLHAGPLGFAGPMACRGGCRQAQPSARAARLRCSPLPLRGPGWHPHVWCFCASGLLCGPCVAPAALGASAQQAALAWPAARGRRLANRPWPSPAPPLAPPCCS